MQTHTVLHLQNATIHVALWAAKAVPMNVKERASDVATKRIFPVLQRKHGR